MPYAIHEQLSDKGNSTDHMYEIHKADKEVGSQGVNAHMRGK